MENRLLLIFCALNLISLIYAVTENFSDDNGYDFDGLISKNVDRYDNSLRAEQFSALQQFKFGGIENEWESKFIGNSQQNSSKCFGDILYIIKNIGSPWAVKLIDSYGKPESSILKGNIRWIGDYNECIDVRPSNPNSNTIGNFRGKYCSLTWSLKPLNWSKSFTFVTGICVPDSCTVEDLQPNTLELLNIAGIMPVLSNVNSTFKFVELKCKPTVRHLNMGAKVMIALLSIFFTLTVLGSSITIVKYFKKVISKSIPHSFHAGDKYVNSQLDGDVDSKLHKHGLQVDEALPRDGEAVAIRVSPLRSLKKFLGCFCVFTNGAKLLNTSSSEGELLCIHGIRFLSMSWIILSHSYAFTYGHIKNMLEVASLMESFAFQVITQGGFAVDSFFVLSGFLLTYMTMKEFFKPKGRISWPYFYIHRYIRLTPMYMVVLGFSATLYLYLGSGPYWPNGDYDEACSKIWWRNLLYINNFDVEVGQCLSWSWYLANDMQFFIISPLFLITLWRWPKIGYSLLAFFLLVSCLCNFFITYHFNLSNSMVTFLKDGLDMEEIGKRYLEYFSKVYVKPYTRIGPYLLGMFTAFIFMKRKTNNAPKHSLVFLTVGWIVASTVTLSTIYGLYHANPGLIARSFYYALSHVCYAAGLCWVIYICLIGQGGLVNNLLSFKLYIPLSRLTYAAYLIHPLIINGYMQSLNSSLEFSHPTIVVLFFGFIFVTYAISIPVALILESPIVMIEKLIRKKPASEKKIEADK